MGENSLRHKEEPWRLARVRTPPPWGYWPLVA